MSDVAQGTTGSVDGTGMLNEPQFESWSVDDAGNNTVASAGDPRGWNVVHPSDCGAPSPHTIPLTIAVPSNAGTGSYTAYSTWPAPGYGSQGPGCSASATFTVVAPETGCAGPGPCPCGN